MINDILVLGQQRTGSNLLCHAFSFFENFRVINEFFSLDYSTFVYDMYFTNDEKEKLFQFYKTTNWRELLDKVHAEPIKAFEFLESIIGQKNKVVKLFDIHFGRNNDLYSIVNRTNKIILLERTNTLEQYVSLKIAQENDVWGAENTDHCKVNVDIQDYKNFCNNKIVFYENLRQKLSHKKILTINYEKELSNGITTDLLDKLQNFTGIPYTIDSENVNGVWRKQRTIKCTDQISNFDSIKNHLFL